MRRADAIAVVILAGGEATRYPRKLESEVDGTPLLLRVYENLRGAGPVYLSANRSFAPALDAAIDCPVIVDRWLRRGPLGALHTAFGAVTEKRVFVAAGDAPFVGRDAVEELAAAWEPGVEAVVPEHAGRLEPLCAMYARTAFLRESYEILTSGSGSVAAIVERLKTKRVRLRDERAFTNLNTAEDRDAVFR